MVENPSVNLLLTEKCAGKCPYCFNGAVQEHTLDQHKTTMDLEAVEIALEFLIRSQIKQVRLMGGEPLLYPKLGELMDLVYRADSWDNIIIFTSGIFPQSAFQYIDSSKTHIVFNINNPSIYKNNEHDIIRKNLRLAVENGFLVTFGYNIYQEKFDYSFLLKLAEEFGVESIRVCIANPIGTMQTEILRGTQRKNVGSRILEMVEACSKQEIGIVFDCILPQCLFSDEEYGRLGKLMKGNAMRDGVCSPALDIRPDLTVHRCFAMGDDLRVHIKDFSNSGELADYFIESTDRFKWLIPPEGCEDCPEYLNRKCQGDCLGFHLGTIKKARDLETGSVSLFHDAYNALSDGNSVLSLDLFEIAFNAYPYNASALCDYIYLLVKFGFVTKARELADRYEHVLRTEGRGKELFIKGIISEASGDIDKAISNYRGSLRSLKSDKRDFVSARILGLVGDRENNEQQQPR